MKFRGHNQGHLHYQLPALLGVSCIGYTVFYFNLLIEVTLSRTVKYFWGFWIVVASSCSLLTVIWLCRRQHLFRGIPLMGWWLPWAQRMRREGAIDVPVVGEGVSSSLAKFVAQFLLRKLEAFHRWRNLRSLAHAALKTRVNVNWHPLKFLGLSKRTSCPR